MNRLLSLLLLSLLTVVICTTRTSSQSTSDEETLKKLEMERVKHAGNSDADIAFGKSIIAERLVTVDALGHVTDQTPGEFEKTSLGMRKADPDVKLSAEMQDIKVRISGDTAIVMSTVTYSETGHKDSRYDVSTAKIAVVDTWQKRAGHWKLLAQAFVATDSIPAEYYKLPPSPGSTDVK